MLQAGETFDVMFTCQWWNYFGPLAARGDLCPLDGLLAEYGQDITRQVDAPYFQAMSFGGKTYAVPNVQGFSQIKGLTFHADLVDKYNFDYKSVKTLADVEGYLQTILENEPGVTPFLPGTGARDLIPPKDGDPEPVTYWLNYDPAANALTPSFYDEVRELPYWRFMREWYNKGYIAKDAASKIVWGDEIRTGQYAVMPNFSYVNDGEANTAAYGFRVYDIPIYAASPIRTADIQNSAVGISRTSTHPDSAMQMINAVWADPEIFNTMVFGVEGFHWNWLDKSQLLIDTTGEWEAGYSEPNNYMIAGIANLYGRESYPRSQIEAELATNDTTPKSFLMGFAYDGSSVETETAAFNAIIDEVQYLLGTGTVDPDVEVPKILDRLFAVGYQTLIDDFQKQVDEWRAANGK
jgi:putative aldouronate transport system substrate-binding protein